MAGKKTGSNPTDRAKKGTKRSVLTDALGIPLSIAVDGANRHDMKRSRETLENIKAKRPEPTKEKEQGLCLDKAGLRNFLSPFHSVHKNFLATTQPFLSGNIISNR